MNTASEPGPQIHTHREPKHRTSGVLFCSVAKKARTKQDECGALMVKGHKVIPVIGPGFCLQRSSLCIAGT
jgi:hypothetical protein